MVFPFTHALKSGIILRDIIAIKKKGEYSVKRPDKLQTITVQNFKDLAVDFKVELPEKFLYEK